MNSSYMDVDGFGPQIKENELIAIIQNHKEDQDRQLAFKTLLQRKSKKIQELAIHVLNDPLYDRRLQLTAANFLGKKASKDGVKNLCKALKNTKSKSLQSRLLNAIGKVGDLDALKALEGMSSKAALFARTLIAYRHGIKGYALPPVDTKRFSKRLKYAAISSIAITPARAKELNEMIETQLDILEAFKLPKLKLNCAGKDLYVMQSDAISEKQLLPTLQEAPSIPMKIFSVNDCPRRAVLSYYIMTHPVPEKDNAISVKLVTSSGKTAYSGEIVLKDNQFELSIKTAIDTVLPATTIKGVFNPKKGLFDFSELLSHLKLDTEKRKVPRKNIS